MKIRPLTLAFAAVLFVVATHSVAEAQNFKNKSFALDVVVDLTSFNVAPAMIQGLGAFPNGVIFLRGDIYEEGTLLGDGTLPPGSAPIGKWFLTGFLHEGELTSTEVYRLDDGQVAAAQGGPFDLAANVTAAVTGGTGPFKGIVGEVALVRLAPEPLLTSNYNFRATFTLDRRAFAG